MSKPSASNASKYEALVLAVATGVSIIEWCRQTGTSRTTVSQWQTDPQFEKDVAKIRRELLQRAIGRFTAAVDKVADGMLELAEKAVSEPTKLAAQRAVLENLVQLTEFSEFKRRLTAIEARLDVERRLDEERESA